MMPEITLSTDNRQVKIVATVKDSLHASLLADRLNTTPYLKVFDRTYQNGIATIRAHTIRKIFTIENLTADLETMESLMNLNANTDEN